MSRQMISFRRQYGDVHVVCALHSATNPSDAEWDEYIAHIATMKQLTGERFRDAAGFAITDGGAPNAAQRKRLADIAGKEEPLGAVVSDSMMVRGVVTALSWLGIRVRAFGVGEIAAAMRWAHVPDEEHASLLTELREMAKQVEGGVHTVEKLR